jgi:hypothetical protein
MSGSLIQAKKAKVSMLEPKKTLFFFLFSLPFVFGFWKQFSLFFAAATQRQEKGQTRQDKTRQRQDKTKQKQKTRQRQDKIRS